MTLSLEQWQQQVNDRLNRLDNHLRPDTLNTFNKQAYSAINEVAARPYTRRRSVDKWECGVTVTGLNQSIEWARQIDIGLDNREKIEKALRSGDPLEFQPGRTYVTGALTGQNLPLNITGAGLDSVIVQMENAHLFDFQSSNLYRSLVQVENLCIEAGRHITGDHAAFRLAPYTTGGDTSGYIRNVTIRRRSDLEAEYNIGVWIDNPNEFDFSNVRYLGRLNPQGTAFRLRGNKANISFAFYNCKAYDCIHSFDFESSSVPGLEGIMMTKCDAVGVTYGFSFRSTAPNDQYLPPQIDLVSCHANIIDKPGGKAFYVKNYAQVNLTNCSAYGDGSTEKQYGFDLDTVSEANITGCRAYRNQNKLESTDLFTAIRFGPNCILNKVQFLTSYVGKPNQVYEFTENSARNDCWHGNDESEPDQYLINEGVDNNIYSQRLYGGVTDNPLMSAYWPSWKTRTQDENLRVTRYPSDHPLYPDQLSVESYQQTLDAYTTPEGPATIYWKLWESQDITSAGNRDFVHFTAQVGRWNAFGDDVARQQLDIRLSTRETPDVFWQSRGKLSSSGVLIKQHSGKVSAWLCLSGSSGELQSGSVTPVSVLAAAPFARRLWAPDADNSYYTSETGSIGTVTAPAGTTLLDTRRPDLYPPDTLQTGLVRQSRTEQDDTTPTTDDILPGYCMQVYDPAKQEIVTWYHDPDDSVMPVKASMRKPVPVTNYTQFLADKSGGVTKFPLWNTRDQRYEYIDIATAKEWLGLNWIYQTSWAQVYELLDARYVRGT